MSDSHQCVDALVAAVDAGARAGGFDKIWFLGDCVGHMETTKCNHVWKSLEWLAQYGAMCVFGNWEYWLLHPERDILEQQSAYAVDLADLRRSLAGDGLRILASWPGILKQDGFTITHGSPYHNHTQYNPRVPCEVYLRPIDTEEVGYVFALNRIDTPHLIVGHTHQPGYFDYQGSSPMWHDADESVLQRPIYMKPRVRYLLNPGSVSCNNFNPNVPSGTALILDTDNRSFQFLRLFAVGRNG